MEMPFDALQKASLPDADSRKGAMESKSFKRAQMLKIQRTANGETLFRLIGSVNAENVTELKSLLRSEPKGPRIALDLKDLTLVDGVAVAFLRRCEAASI